MYRLYEIYLRRPRAPAGTMCQIDQGDGGGVPSCFVVERSKALGRRTIERLCYIVRPN